MNGGGGRSRSRGSVLAVGCGAPPWQLGKPLDGRPSIPPDQAVLSPAQAAADAEKERAAGRRVLEISALQKLDTADALSGPAPPAPGRAADGARDRVSCARARHSGERRSGDRRAPGPDARREARPGTGGRGGGGGRCLEGDRRARGGAGGVHACGGARRRAGGRRRDRPAARRGAGGDRPGSHPPTSTATCSAARRCRRGWCRWLPRSRGCSTTRRGRCSGRSCCSPRTRPRPTCWSWSP